ncbi:MAG: TonB-dependent receptor [Bacteroidota bacterium]
MKTNYLIVTLLLLSSNTFLHAQQTDSIVKLNINEVIISANKVEEEKKNVSQQVLFLNSNDIIRLQAQTTGDLLSNTGLIGVQKSQQGGGSPVLRGFEASKVLLVVDGIRMNNIIYRAGHLQNIITTDNTIFERVEVLMGPSSTMYGSDALGGVIHMMTRNPQLSTESGKMKLKVNAMSRYGSANKESTNHIDVNIGGGKLASLTSFTYSSFDDLKGGENQNPFYTGSYGERPYYAERINNADSVIKNDDRYLQVQSGYTQYDLLQKFLYQSSENISHGLNIQYSNSSDIPRYDRLTDLAGGTLRYSEWYYGPQERLLTAYNLDINNSTAFFSRIKSIISYQHIKESRHNRSLAKSGLSNRIEEVDVMGFTTDFLHTAASHKVRTGIDVQYNTLLSTANTKNINTSVETPLDTRYPGGDNSMMNAAAYISHSWQIDPQLIINDGLRLGYSSLNAEFNDTSFFSFPFSTVEQTNFIYSGNIGIVHLPTDDLKLSLLFSTGFRVPNVDDLAKVFESGNGIIIVPNADLKPEQTFNSELAITWNANDHSEWENNIYYTQISDALVTDKFTYNGQDSINYDGVLSAVYANQNKGEAYIYGFTTSYKTSAANNLTFAAALGYTYGRVKTDSSDVPLDHISPVTGRVSLGYHKNRFQSDFFINFNGWKKLKDYSGGGEDNGQYATPDGMPAWFTANLHLSYQLNKWLSIYTGVDNLFDTQYRVFASGINAPGRNFFGALRFTY